MTFEEFLGLRLPALLRYATVLACDPHLAEDIVQEVLARAQTRWARISAADRPEAYVKRMILNELASWRRRRAATVRSHASHALATLVRIAQSVRTTSLTMSYRMRLPWIPARYRGKNHVSAAVRPATDGGWVIGLDESPSYNGGGIGVSVSNRPQLISAYLSWQLKRDDGTYAYASKQLGDKHPITEADAMRMMREFEFEFEFAPPDMSWVLP